MKILNLTPHPINFIREDCTLTIPPSGTVARVNAKTEQIGDVDGIPIFTKVFGEVQDLPAPETDTVYVVSSIVASRVRGRTDVLVPEDTVRDEAGRIIGCRALAWI